MKAHFTIVSYKNILLDKDLEEIVLPVHGNEFYVHGKRYLHSSSGFCLDNCLWNAIFDNNLNSPKNKSGKGEDFCELVKYFSFFNSDEEWLRERRERHPKDIMVAFYGDEISCPIEYLRKYPQILNYPIALKGFLEVGVEHHKALDDFLSSRDEISK